MWGKWGLPPSWLNERTPNEILFLFGTEGDQEDESGEIDQMAELHRINHVVSMRTFRQPIVPGWLMPNAPRRERERTVGDVPGVNAPPR